MSSSPRTPTEDPNSRAGWIAPSVASLLALACFAYVMWRPVSNGQILYPVLAILAVVSLLSMARQRFQAATELLVAGGMLLLVVLFGLSLGFAQATPGAGHQAAVWLGGAAVWAPWALSMRVVDVRPVLFTVAIATIVVSALIVLYVAYETGLLPIPMPDSLLVSQGAGFNEVDSSTAIRLYGLSTLTIVAPLCAAGVILRPDTLLPPRRLLLVAALLATVASLVSGRRGIAVVTIIAPFLALMLQRSLTPRSSPIKVPIWIPLSLPILFLAALVAPISGPARQATNAVSDASSMFLGMGSSTSDVVSDAARVAQMSELLDGWSVSPIIGHGLGATLSTGFTRSAERPWMFELQYLQLLFSTGIIGVLLTVGALATLCVALRRAALRAPQHRSVLVATTVAATALLMANVSNPYLQAVGHQWGVALGAGVIGALLKTQAAKGQLWQESNAADHLSESI